MNAMIIVDPAAESAAPGTALAPRLESLAGARLALIDNSKHRADVFLDRLQEVLADQYGVAACVRYRKTNPSIPTPAEALAELLAGNHALIHAIAD
jgi:hypothetical protein